jgi:glycosyltransferase involved in cell wall biosynthesis
MKICFVGEAICEAMNGNITGGAEKQQALLIQGLKKKGFDVLVYEYLRKKFEEISGIKFYSAWGNSKFILKRIINLKRSIVKEKVDVVYVRGTSAYAAVLFLLLKLSRRKIKLLFGIAGDHNLTSKLNYVRRRAAKTIYGKLNAGIIYTISSKMCFYLSDVIICQTEEQENMAKSINPKKSIVTITNIYEHNNKQDDSIVKFENVDAIWIGKFAGNKGEDVLLSLARQMPHMTILCLGHVSKDFENTEVYKGLCAQKNIIMTGRVKSSQISSYISCAKFVLNTSPAEGFSNVFLEGWHMEKPVISFKVNPNRYLSDGQAGYCANGNESDLVQKLNEILSDQNYFIFHGKKGKEILLKNHNADLIISKFVDVLSITQ